MTDFVGMLQKMFADSMNESIEGMNASLKEHADIETYNNICYGTDNKWNTLDIYRPIDKKAERLPIIISVHGGGWIYGTKEEYRYYCMTLAEQGYAVINFNYRLAPEYCFPAPVEDLNTLVYWLYENEDKYLLDMDKLYAVGDSAGAHILGQYATICTNESYAARFAFAQKIPVQSIFCAIALNCGVYYADVEKKKSDFIRIIALEYLGFDHRGIKERECPEEFTDKTDIFEYGKYITRQFPDTFLMSADTDFAKEHSARLATELVKQSVNFEFHMYVSKTQKLEHVFHTDLRLSEARTCNLEELAFFRKYR